MLSEIPESLFTDSWIDEVAHVVSSGKEGTVYCCTSASDPNHQLVAVKVYRSRNQRTFRNNQIYNQGRSAGVRVDRFTGTVRPSGKPDRRLQKAMKSKSRFGQLAAQASWTQHEFVTLKALHAAGARVPLPIHSTDSAIVMEYLGDLHGPAPRLRDVRIPPAAQSGVFQRVLDEIELWLACERIHADLSPFNILYWEGEVTAIDFPQAVSPYENPMGFSFLLRDVENVCTYFRDVPLAQDPMRIATRLWRTHVTG